MKAVFAMLLGVSVLFAFQNCSDVSFDDLEPSSSSKTGDGDLPGIPVPDLTDDNNEVAVDPDDPALARYACEGEEEGKHVYVCHFPPGNPEALHTLCIGAPALQAHLHHGRELPMDSNHPVDLVGKCEELF